LSGREEKEIVFFMHRGFSGSLMDTHFGLS
jgi:hypothetical protein